LAVGYSHPIPEAWAGRLASHPGVARVAPYLYGFGLWHKPDGGTEQCFIIGARLEPGAVGALADLSPELGDRLTRPGSVAVFGPDRDRLGLRGAGDVSEVAGQRVEVAGVLREGDRGAGLMPGVVCSLRTARLLLPELGPHQAHYLVARCHPSADADGVAQRLRREFPGMAVMTRDEFARRTQVYWLTKTRAGLVLCFSALLGLLVGAVITSQTLYAATQAAQRELAVLRALGIPRGRVAGLVLAQSGWVAALGVGLALPATLGIARLGVEFGIEPQLPAWLLAATALVTAGMALLSGLAALRSIDQVEPVNLLR
jgi:putative ABC transport system permease protein